MVEVETISSQFELHFSYLVRSYIHIFTLPFGRDYTLEDVLEETYKLPNFLTSKMPKRSLIKLQNN